MGLQKVRHEYLFFPSGDSRWFLELAYPGSWELTGHISPQLYVLWFQTGSLKLGMAGVYILRSQQRVQIRISLFLLSEMCLSGHIGCLAHIHLLPFLLTEPQFCSSIGLSPENESWLGFLATDWFRDGPVTQFWPFRCKGASAGGEVLWGKFCFWKGL